MEEGASPIEQLSKSLGGGMSAKDKKERYFGTPPKDTYFGFGNKGPKHIHDLQMSPEQKNRLYGLGGGREKDAGDIVGARLETDTKAGLVRELADQTALTRAEAEELVSAWMAKNSLVEINDPQLGKIIAPRGRR